jgi:glyoxylase-like metal-dependent hydrolase (beta-lactamase superfamily II)
LSRIVHSPVGRYRGVINIDKAMTMHMHTAALRIITSFMFATLATAGCANNGAMRATEPDATPSALSTQVYVSAPEAFSATSTLILGESSAILVDAQFTLSEGAKVAEWIAGTGKQLQAIYITHAHPDHYFGVVSVLEQFPDTPVYTKAVVREHMLANAAKDLEEWKPIYGDELPDEPVFPEVLEADFLTLEGHRIDIVSLEQADMEDVTAVHIPDIDTVITGDLTYRGMHAWLAETDKEARAAWLESIEQIKALAPEVVISGHKVPSLADDPVVLDDTAAYLHKFDELLVQSADADALFAAMKQAYPDLAGDIILQFATQAAYASGS